MSIINTQWELYDGKHQLSITANGKTLMETRWKYSLATDEDLEYMRLAAAAPDLLKALQGLLDNRPTELGFPSNAGAERYMEALAKAELAVGKAIVSPKCKNMDAQPIANTMDWAINELQKL